ncbi:MAG: glyceraldehyde-3-phosphate dehydrogenase [Pseudomonadota bacterium]
MSDSDIETLVDWKTKEATAEAMIPLIGRLYRESNIVTSIFGQPIINRSVIDLIKAHRFARQVIEHELSFTLTKSLLDEIVNLQLAPCRIDLGHLSRQYQEQSAASAISIKDFLQEKLAGAFKSHQKQTHISEDCKDVVLYGFGRIGRLLARILVEKTGGGDGLRLKAIVVRKGKAPNDLEKRASLLRRDSVHGSFQGTISIDEERNQLIVNGNRIQIIYSNDPTTIDYTQYGIEKALVIDNTGVWRDEAGLSQHLKANGVSRVLLTAPGKGAIKNIVFGVNDSIVNQDDRILSAASCTTNAIVPVLKIVNDAYGVDRGHIETVHAYTNDQNLIDNYHTGYRRGRSAPLNMVITETGAAKAAAKALPELAGKLTGNAIRVPIPNVSLAILNLTLTAEPSKKDINYLLRSMALHSPLRKQIDFVSSPEVVSSDFVGSRRAAIFDAESTIVNGKSAVLYLWYDNEFGYSAQVVRLAQKIAGIEYPVFPENT